MTDHTGETPQQWHAYFNVHGDPSVVADPDRPSFTTIATVATTPDDYGRANAVLLAAAPEMLALLRRVGHRCTRFGHRDPTSAEKRVRNDCADDQCRNPACVTYSECGDVKHDIAALFDRLEGADIGSKGVHKNARLAVGADSLDGGAVGDPPPPSPSSCPTCQVPNQDQRTAEEWAGVRCEDPWHAAEFGSQGGSDA